MSLTGVYDHDFLIALELSDADLFNLCQTSKHLKQICQDPVFWYQRIVKYYPGVPLTKNMDYQKVYKELHDLAYNYCLLVDDNGKYYTIRNISEAVYPGVVIGKPGTLINMPSGLIRIVYLQRYDEPFPSSPPILSIANNSYHWDLNWYHKLLPINFHYPEKIILSFERRGGFYYTMVYRGLTPQVMEKLLEAAHKNLTRYPNEYVVIQGHQSTVYDFDPLEDRFVRQH